MCLCTNQRFCLELCYSLPLSTWIWLAEVGRGESGFWQLESTTPGAAGLCPSKADHFQLTFLAIIHILTSSVSFDISPLSWLSALDIPVFPSRSSSHLTSSLKSSELPYPVGWNDCIMVYIILKFLQRHIYLYHWRSMFYKNRNHVNAPNIIGAPFSLHSQTSN